MRILALESKVTPINNNKMAHFPKNKNNIAILAHQYNKITK